MNKLSTTLVIGTIIFLSSASINASEFFYKSKQVNDGLTRYNQVVTATSLIKNIKIITKETRKTVIFNELQNRENPEKKYSGKIEIEKIAGDFNKKITFVIKDSQNRKDFILNIETNNEESIMKNIFSPTKGDLLNYLSKSKFDLFIENLNDNTF